MTGLPLVLLRSEGVALLAMAMVLYARYSGAGKIATWLSKLTLQRIASGRVHDDFQSGSAGEARSRASAAVVI